MTEIGPSKISIAEVSSKEIGTVTSNVAKISPHEISIGEISFPKIGSRKAALSEVSNEEVSPHETSFSQIGTSKVGFSEIGKGEVSTGEAGTSEIRPHAKMLFPPLIPNLYPLSKYLKMLLVRHRFPPCRFSSLAKDARLSTLFQLS